MKIVLLNMVWPALYVSETFWKFWFFVFGTIIIELFTVKFFLKFSWIKSLIVSIVGNLVSGFLGTFIMMWAMLFWHLIADNFVPHATFDIINWVATFVLMCLGSVFFETLTIKLIYKEKIKRLFLPMLTGNLLSYAFIAFVMITKTDKDPDEVRTEVIKYVPTKQQFILLDSSAMQIDTCIINVSYDKEGKRLNDTKSKGYSLLIPFTKQRAGDFQFQLRIAGDEFAGGISESSKSFQFTELKDDYKIILEQKNPDTTYGWTKPIVTDTLIFKRILEHD